MSNALCIGGAFDGKTVPILTPPHTTDYSLFHIDMGTAQPIYMYVSNDIMPTTAVHMVFAAYAKKGKK